MHDTAIKGRVSRILTNDILVAAFIYICIMDNGFPVYIKHMVCPRCIKAVKEEVEKLGLGINSIKLGELILTKKPEDSDLQELRENLDAQGFEIISDHKSNVINRIKTEIIKLIRNNLARIFVPEEVLPVSSIERTELGSKVKRN